MKYFRNKRERMFPHITDWTLPYDEIRNDNNVKAMDYGTWFRFHPTAFKTLQIGAPSIPIFVFGIITILGFVWGKEYLVIIGLLMVVPFAFKLRTALKEIKRVKNMTYYDLYLRDYPEEQDKEEKEVKEDGLEPKNSIV